MGAVRGMEGTRLQDRVAARHHRCSAVDLVSEAEELSCCSLASRLRLRCGFVDTAFKVFERFFQTLAQLDLRFPTEELFRFGDVGTAAGGVVLREGMKDYFGLRASDGEYLARALKDGPLVGVADVDREMFVRVREEHDAIDEI